MDGRLVRNGTDLKAEKDAKKVLIQFFKYERPTLRKFAKDMDICCMGILGGWVGAVCVSVCVCVLNLILCTLFFVSYKVILDEMFLP